MKSNLSCIVTSLLLAFSAVDVRGAEEAEQKFLPAGWVGAWQQPPLSDRPLQIVHGINPRLALPDGVDQMVPGGAGTSSEPRGMQYYVDHGLGGIVCNVAFDKYLQSQEHWQTLVAGIRQCEKLGMVVWLYDEEGYPSGAAGGLVLAENKAFEAVELAFDASRQDPFVIRPAYEHTHANNNYHASRRYANLIDDRAMGTFIAKTHDAYWERLEPFFGKTIQAFFTDEPSLIAVNLGAIPEPARSRVPIVDPPDAQAKVLPSVPWCYDLPELYQRRYGQPIEPHRKSLFGGDSTEDRQVRYQFWSLIADLMAERYFGALQQWCSTHSVASSGHTLWEEAVIHHVPLEGNALKALARMDIPGLDMLSSDPEAVLHSGWLTAALPCSAAELSGGRRVMTEVSDFSQKMGGSGPAGLAEMQATAAWQAAWGVTEFTLYYGMRDRSLEDYRAYCKYVGRLNALLKPARRASEVLLYYPIHDLWSEYLPVAEPLKLESQSPRAQQLVQSFMKLGQYLQRNQIPFTIVDHEQLADIAARADGSVRPGEGQYATVILPQSVELPASLERLITGWQAQGGVVLRDEGRNPEETLRALNGAYRLSRPEMRVALGRFQRDGREILFLVNTGREPYQGELIGAEGAWLRMDPATGDMESVQCGVNGLVLELAPRQSLAYVKAP